MKWKLMLVMVIILPTVLGATISKSGYKISVKTPADSGNRIEKSGYVLSYLLDSKSYGTYINKSGYKISLTLYSEGVGGRYKKGSTTVSISTVSPNQSSVIRTGQHYIKIRASINAASEYYKLFLNPERHFNFTSDIPNPTGGSSAPSINVYFYFRAPNLTIYGPYEGQVETSYGTNYIYYYDLDPPNGWMLGYYDVRVNVTYSGGEEISSFNKNSDLFLLRDYEKFSMSLSYHINTTSDPTNSTDEIHVDSSEYIGSNESVVFAVVPTEKLLDKSFTPGENYTLSFDYEIGKKFLFVFTEGGWSRITDKKSQVVENEFLRLPFSYEMLSSNLIFVLLLRDDINLVSSPTCTKGTKEIFLKNLGRDANGRWMIEVDCR